jgi:hypothetical protein
MLQKIKYKREGTVFTSLSSLLLTHFVQISYKSDTLRNVGTRQQFWCIPPLSVNDTENDKVSRKLVPGTKYVHLLRSLQLLLETCRT